MKSELIIAAETGNISSFRRVLNQGLDINERDDTGTTPLMIACKLGHTELVKFMLSRGADISLVNKQGMTALQNAEVSNKTDLINLLGGTNQDDLISKQNDIHSSLLNLIDNLSPVLKEIEPIIASLTEEQRKKITTNFEIIISLLRSGNELTLYDGVALAMAMALLKWPDKYQQGIKHMKNLPTLELENIIKELLSTEGKFCQNLSVTFQTFSLNSVEAFTIEDLAKFKKALYEFAIIVVNADGIITERESETLKFLSQSFFSEKKIGIKSSLYEELSKPDLVSVLEELNNLVGMDNIKADIHSLINLINVNKLRNREGLPEMKISLHSVFMGPPGTGKTTIARILSKIYYALDILPANNFKETDRSGLVGGYIGQTAIKTDQIITEALNGILFIDEAYSLAGENMDDYGKEAISTLLKRMEDYRDKLIIIVAGYEHEMTHFINSNPGLKSRFNKYFHFKDYTPTELTEIYKRRAEDMKLILKEETLSKAKELFESLYSVKDNAFGNARVARNAFEKTYENMANRTSSLTSITKEILTTIEPIDIPSAAELKQLE